MPEEPFDLASLVRAHGPYVWRALRHLGVSPSELDDEAQEVFLVAYRRRDDFAGVANVRGWLYGVCIRRAMQWRRTRRRHPVASTPVGEEPSTSADAEERLALGDDRAALAWILEQLDDDKRTVFVMHDVEGQPMSAIVEALGCPLQTGYSRLRAAREEVARAAHRAKMTGRLG